TKIAAGLAMGTLWTLSKGMGIGSIVLCADGEGAYRVCEVNSEYEHVPDGVLPHRRRVKWLDRTINREEMTDGLRRSCLAGSIVCELMPHADEIERLIQGASAPTIVSTDKTVEDPTAFAMEKHLEDFLVKNWRSTELGVEFDIYEDDGELIGQQYQTDTGPLDILAISKDKQTLLIVELKKGRASDVVVGQILRYMGFVKEELAEPNQEVRGVVIALEDDQRLRRALSMVPAIDFFRYEISFSLVRG
ncbi:MAG: DUF91 domain-containing protein, partial [bacterium]|nr:DUF91 domain-containing protein [bacterium]